VYTQVEAGEELEPEPELELPPKILLKILAPDAATAATELVPPVAVFRATAGLAAGLSTKYAAIITTTTTTAIMSCF